MKKYTVHFKVTISERMEVVAENEEEAKKRALEDMEHRTDPYELVGIDFNGEFTPSYDHLTRISAKMRSCARNRNQDNMDAMLDCMKKRS